MYQIDGRNFSGKTVLIRVDFNVPLNDKFEVTDDTRIRAAAKTIKKIIADGGRAVLMSHLGRPKGGPEDKFSLRHIVANVSSILGVPVAFAEDCIGDKAKAVIHTMKNGDVALLENLRFYKEEEAGDEFFAGQIAELGDVYVNDAFGTAHRAHASTAIIARFFPTDRLFGYLMEDEVKNIEKVLHGDNKPVTAIIGGSKVSSKIAIIENPSIPFNIDISLEKKKGFSFTGNIGRLQRIPLLYSLKTFQQTCYLGKLKSLYSTS
jgi:phosphoglycerate kinase